MARVAVCLRLTTEDDEYGNELEACYLQCLKCGKESETSFVSQDDGGLRSIKRCFVLLRKSCKENNFYQPATAKCACGEC